MVNGLIDGAELRRRIDSLSMRQREILTLVAQHLSSKEIARLLGIRATTVDNYVVVAVKRLGVANRREAAALIMELGYASGIPDQGLTRAPTENPHGENLPTRRWGLPWRTAASNFFATFRNRNELGVVSLDDRAQRSRIAGLEVFFIRFLFDAMFIVLFFAAMSSAAYGVHWIVVQWEQRNIDHVILVILKGVSYVLVLLDAIGVVMAAGLLTQRFIRAFARTND